jgi:serine/threonine-protein kinase
MSHERVQQLLEEILERDRTPEEVCAGDPELLKEVRARWALLQRVESQLDELFPRMDSVKSDDGPSESSEPKAQIALPPIEGYEVESVLGWGGMGVVFKARQLTPSRPVALKMLLSGAHARPQELLRFRREIAAVATLQHPNIVQVYEVGEHAGRPFFTMEFVTGGSLARQLAQGLPTPQRAAELVAALAVTIQFAHQSGIIHRDLKPGNILLTGPLSTEADRSSGVSWGAPKIADFGLARFVHAGPELTLSGTRMGTPSYMAPEQALGKVSAIGPAVDIYALGAILYEALTGHPPFEGSTAQETERRVISEEPTPPSRIRAHIPRDVETICLKCLHKNPARRYASAQDLADDLHRFLDGKPVRARPVGVPERAIKWARRRPAAALLVATLVVLVGAAVGTGAWFQQQRAEQREAKTQRETQARQVIQGALDRVAKHRQKEQWREAKLVLTEAERHLADADSPELEEQLRQVRADIRFADELEGVRDSRPVRDGWNPDYRLRATSYREVFDRAGLRIAGADVDALVSTIRESAVRDQIVAALDDWAFMAFMVKDAALVERLLLIARSADPEPRWRNQFRNPVTWRSTERLRELAGAALAIDPLPPGHQLALLGLLLKENKSAHRTTELLREACRRRPSNFWLNREMGDALRAEGRLEEAIGFYRAALAVRPENPGVFEALGAVFLRRNQTEEALAAYYCATEFAPPNHSSRGMLVLTLVQCGYWQEAEVECRRAQELDPTNWFPPFRLAQALHHQHRHDEAIIMCQKAIEIAPPLDRRYLTLANILAGMNRHEEAARAYRKEIELFPTNYLLRRSVAFELARAGKVEEAIAELRTAIAVSPPHSGFHMDLGALLRRQGRLEEAVAALRKAAELASWSGTVWELLAATRLDRGDFAEARIALERLVTVYGTDAERRARRRQLESCNALRAIESRLPAILAGTEQPTDVATQLALAEWCLKHRRFTALAADFYAQALAAYPSPADDREAAIRVDAACAAALAGCGVGADVAPLDGPSRAALRQQALGWLTAEYTVWAERHRQGKPGDRQLAATTVRAWLVSEDLAPVRDEQALTALPADERRSWHAFWERVSLLAARDPGVRLGRAREHIGRCEWVKAAACYAEALELEPTDNGELWFEYAAAQLLAGDRPGYRRACEHMLARGPGTPQLRAYHVARACTLASDADPVQPGRLAGSELSQNGTTFWSLTEQGALRVRAGQFEEAVPLLERSTEVDGRPGRAVLNWLWLALAHQKMGKPNQARRWLDKATRWLDQQRGRMPFDTAEMGAHLHNWLEAHVLRAEVELLLAPAQGPAH